MLEIEYTPISEIKPYTGNAKKHPPGQVEEIKQSITDFGFNDPIATWNGEIVEGHGRYLAAKALHIEKVPVIRLDGLTDEQRKAYTLIHNKLTMDSDIDVDKLRIELDAIESIDMEDYGFDLTPVELPDTGGILRRRELQKPQRDKGLRLRPRQVSRQIRYAYVRAG